MGDCKYHDDVCGLSNDYDEEAGLCILHSKKPDKDPQDFADALERHRRERRDDFSYMVFPGETDFRDATFERGVAFINTTFEGKTNFRDAIFKEIVAFSGAVFKRGVAFSDVIFEGETFFNRATFKGETDFSGATFKGAIEFSSSRFKGETHFSSATFEEVADFSSSRFEGNRKPNAYPNTYVRDAKFKGVTRFYGAYLVGSYFATTNLRGANFAYAHLEGTTFERVNLKGVDASFAIVDGETLLTDCEINNKTLFEGVGLDSARIDSKIKAKLKRNIRAHYWKEWYTRISRLENVWPFRLLPRLLSTRRIWRVLSVLLWLLLLPVRLFWRMLSTLFLLPVRLFWLASDYGSKTLRLLGVFIFLSAVFTFLYFLSTFPAPTGAPDWWPTAPYWWSTVDYPFLEGLDTYRFEHPDGAFGEIPLSFCRRLLRAGYFSVVTMTTLGFGDIHAHPMSPLGHLLVMLQVLIGYVLLGAFITRMAILFREVE